MSELRRTDHGEVLVPRLRLATGMFQRMRGLLGVRSLDADEGLWIQPCNSVHTFFMRFPIDVAFLDKEGVVLKIVPRLRPFRMASGGRRARSALELAPGAAARLGLEVGQALNPRPTASSSS
jgi:uncharacterized membrane protein (UPF0127 family)